MRRCRRAVPRSEPRPRRQIGHDVHDQPNVHAACGGSPAASAKATSAVTAVAAQVGWDAVDDPADLGPTHLGDGIDHLAPCGRQRDRRLSPVRAVHGSTHELPLDQPVAQPRRRRGVHPEQLGEVADAQRTAAREHHQRPVLRQRHVRGRSHRQGTGRDTDERPRRSEQRFGECLRGLLVGAHVGHMCILQALHHAQVVGRAPMCQSSGRIVVRTATTDGRFGVELNPKRTGGSTSASAPRPLPSHVAVTAVNRWRSVAP